MVDTRRKLLMLCGPPRSGKSYAARDYPGYKDAVYLSTDEFIERVARFYGKTYDECFRQVYKRAEKRFNKLLLKVKCLEDKDVIWDQTNLKVKTRLERASLFPGYKKILFFPKQLDWDLLVERNNTSSRGPLSVFKVLRPMFNSYEAPTEEELAQWDEFHEF